MAIDRVPFPLHHIRSQGPSASSRAYISEIVPAEIILMILEAGDFRIRDLAALASTCRRLYQIADLELYKKGVRIDSTHLPVNLVSVSPVMIWAAYNNRIGTMEKLR